MFNCPISNSMCKNRKYTRIAAKLQSGNTFLVLKKYNHDLLRRNSSERSESHIFCNPRPFVQERNIHFKSKVVIVLGIKRSVS